MKKHVMFMVTFALCIALLTGATSTPVANEDMRLHIAFADGAPQKAVIEALDLPGLRILEFKHSFAYEGENFVGGFRPDPSQSRTEVTSAYELAQKSFLSTAIESSETLLHGLKEADWQYGSLQGQLKALRAWAEEMEKYGIRVVSVELQIPASLKGALERRISVFPRVSVESVRAERQRAAAEPDNQFEMAADPPVNSWVPTDAYSLVDEDEYSRYTYQYFGWAEKAGDPNYYLRLFKDGGNHTFEQETHYDGYDYGGNCYWPPLPSPHLPGYWAPCGQVYANDVWQGSWNSNLPRAYYDTTFSNNPEEPNLTIGTADASLLQPGQWYWYWIRTQVTSPKENVPYIKAANDRISMVSQRGRRVPANCYNTWCVFAVPPTVINKAFTAGLIAPSGALQHYWPYQTSKQVLP